MVGRCPAAALFPLGSRWVPFGFLLDSLRVPSAPHARPPPLLAGFILILGSPRVPVGFPSAVGYAMYNGQGLPSEVRASGRRARGRGFMATSPFCVLYCRHWLLPRWASLGRCTLLRGSPRVPSAPHAHPPPLLTGIIHILGSHRVGWGAAASPPRPLPARPPLLRLCLSPYVGRQKAKSRRASMCFFAGSGLAAFGRLILLYTWLRRSPRVPSATHARPPPLLAGIFFFFIFMGRCSVVLRWSLPLRCTGAVGLSGLGRVVTPFSMGLRPHPPFSVKKLYTLRKKVHSLRIAVALLVFPVWRIAQ